MTHTRYIDPRAAVTVAFIAAAAVLGPAANASAYVTYTVWWQDNINIEDFDTGDVSVGGSKLVPPDSACGLRFYDPSHYLWADAYTALISAGDFWKNVHVWFPKSGCPHNVPFIEYQDGSANFPPPSGAYYMQINTNDGVSWIDANGEQLWCELCPIKGLGYAATNVNEPGTLVPPFKTTMAALLEPRQRPFLFNAVLTLNQRLRELTDRLTATIEERRRRHLGAFERTIHNLEEGMLRRLFEAGERTSECQRAVGTGHYTNAFITCAVARDEVDDGQSLLRTAGFFGIPKSR